MIASFASLSVPGKIDRLIAACPCRNKRELAEHLGVNYRTVLDWYRGRSAPQAANLRKMEELYESRGGILSIPDTLLLSAAVESVDGHLSTYSKAIELRNVQAMEVIVRMIASKVVALFRTLNRGPHHTDVVITSEHVFSTELVMEQVLFQPRLSPSKQYELVITQPTGLIDQFLMVLSPHSGSPEHTFTVTDSTIIKVARIIKKQIERYASKAGTARARALPRRPKGSTLP